LYFDELLCNFLVTLLHVCTNAISITLIALNNILQRCLLTALCLLCFYLKIRRVISSFVSISTGHTPFDIPGSLLRKYYVFSCAYNSVEISNTYAFICVLVHYFIAFFCLCICLAYQHFCIFPCQVHFSQMITSDWGICNLSVCFFISKHLDDISLRTSSCARV